MSERFLKIALPITVESQLVLGLCGRYLGREITLLTALRAKTRAKVEFVRNQTWTPGEWGTVGGKLISQNLTWPRGSAE